MGRHAGRTAGIVAALAALLLLVLFLPREEFGQPGAPRTLIERIASALGFGGPGGWFGGSGGSGGRGKRGGKLRSGDQADPRETAVPELVASLGGRVIDEQGKPVEGVRITIRATERAFEKSVASGKDGGFGAEGIPPGTCDIFAVHPHYVALVRPNFTFGPGAAAHCEFVLPLGAIVSGEIADEDGKPLEGVEVGARRHKMEQLAAGGNVFLDEATYKTRSSDAKGAFAVEGLSLGDNVFEFRKPGYEFLAQTVAVKPDEASRKLKITLKRTGHLTGRVINELGEPVSTATVILVRYKPFGAEAAPVDEAKFRVETKADGGFKFERLFNEGFYDLRIEHPDYAVGHFPLVAVGTDGMVCTIDRGGSIEGRAEYIDRDTTPAAVAIVAEAVIKATTVTRTVRSSGDGVFRFERLPYGSYKLSVDSDGFASEPRGEVGVAKDQPVRGVLVEVYQACRAAGRVLSAETDAAIDDAQIVVDSAYGPAQGKRRQFKTRSDAYGVFEFDRLPAGAHVISAEAKGYMKLSGGSSALKFTLQPGERKGDIALRLYRGGVVEGTVSDSAGQLVPDADVQLFVASTMIRGIDCSQLKARTDASGFFRIWGIDVGDHVQLYASARKQGYAKSRSRIIDLTADRTRAQTQILLQAGGTISGKVTDPDRLPIPGAEVKWTTDEFRGDPSPSEGVTHTGADGIYLLTNVSCGVVSLAASRSGFIGQSRDLKMVDGQVRAGEDFSLKPGATIAGRVVALDGRPIPNATVRATPKGSRYVSDSAVSDKKGEFTLRNLPKGDFMLQASFPLKTQDGDQSYQFSLFGVSSGSTNVEIACDVDNFASGIVENENKKRVTAFRFTLKSRTNVTPRQDFVFNLSRNVSGTGGMINVHNLPRGIYSLEVAAEGYELYRDENLTIGPGARTSLPRVKLRTAGGIEGTVVSSSTRRPVNGVDVRVTVMPGLDNPIARVVGSATSDYAGRFRVGLLAPGTYMVTFDHPNYEQGRVDTVSVARRNTTDMGEVILEAGGTVQGSVVDDYGNPLPDIWVSVSGLLPAKRVRTDLAGNYLIQGIKRGSWSIVARAYVRNKPVYSFSSVRIEADQTCTVDFVMELSAGASGIVRGSADRGWLRPSGLFAHPYDENSNVLEDIRYDASVSGQSYSISEIPPGPYFVWGSGYGQNGDFKFWDNLLLHRGANAADFVVGNSSAAGRTVGPRGTGVGGVKMSARPIFDQFGLPQSIQDALTDYTFTAPDGTFFFGNLMPGPWQLLCLDPAGGSEDRWMGQPPVFIGADYGLRGLVVPLPY